MRPLIFAVLITAFASGHGAWGGGAPSADADTPAASPAPSAPSAPSTPSSSAQETPAQEPPAPEAETAPAPAPTGKAKPPATLRPSRAEYVARQGMLSAVGERVIEPRDAPIWRVDSDSTVLLFTFEENATFKVEDGQVTPLHYRYVNPASSRKNADLRFDWDNNIVAETDHKPWQRELTGPTYDRLSYQIQLRLDALRHGAAYPATEYIVAKRKGNRTYRVERTGETVIETPLGRLNTVVFKQTRPGKERVTTLWLAKDWDYIVARTQQEEPDKDTHTLEIKSATVAGKTVTPLE